MPAVVVFPTDLVPKTRFMSYTGCTPCMRFASVWGGVAILLLVAGQARADGHGGAEAPSDSVESVATVRLDADGDRIPDRKGDTVTVAGRSVVGTGTFVPSNHIAVQDPTAGIYVLLPDSVDVGRGDSVRVRGVVEHETGLTRLRALRATLVSEAGRVPTPMPLTVPTARSEAYEGTFVHLRAQVVRVGGNDGESTSSSAIVSEGA